MSVGQGVLMGDLSYVAFGREASYGTYVTGTAGLNVLSGAMKLVKETRVLEEIQTSRTNSNYIQLGRTLEGEFEFYYSPKSTACSLLLQNAFGAAAVTSSTAATAAFQHQFDIGNFTPTNSSLSINARKGESSIGKIFEYKGIRVNELTFTAEIDEPLMCSVALVGQDSTISANDVSSSLDTRAQTPLSFVNGRFSVESSLAALTTTSFWNVQSFEFKVANNLNSDSSARRIGSDVLQVLPAGLATFELKASIRFDTTTAYSAMIAGTELAAEFMFEGPTLTGSTVRESIKLTFPKVVIGDAGDPEIGGPNEPLVSEVVFKVLRDASTTTGYAVRALVVNSDSSV